MPKEYDPRPAATRLAAVQAVYELDMMEADVDDVLASFSAERWLKADDENDQEMARPKPELLKDIVRGVSMHRAPIDAALAPEMIQDRDVDGMEIVLRAILKTATYELLERKNVPSRTLLIAYVSVADAFFDTDGPQSKLISGILNAVARRVRPEEFTSAQEANG